MRSTRQPRSRSAFLTSRSRCALRASLVVQNTTRVFGVRLWRGQPCQKQPSTKTASLAVWKMKSGFPGSGAPRRQPVMPCSRSKCASRCSVLTLPALRTLAINALRFALVRTSAMFAQSSVEPLGFGNPPGESRGQVFAYHFQQFTFALWVNRGRCPTLPSGMNSIPSGALAGGSRAANRVCFRIRRARHSIRGEILR